MLTLETNYSWKDGTTTKTKTSQLDHLFCSNRMSHLNSGPPSQESTTLLPVQETRERERERETLMTNQLDQYHSFAPAAATTTAIDISIATTTTTTAIATTTTIAIAIAITITTSQTATTKISFCDQEVGKLEAWEGRKEGRKRLMLLLTGNQWPQILVSESGMRSLGLANFFDPGHDRYEMELRS